MMSYLQLLEPEWCTLWEAEQWLKEVKSVVTNEKTKLSPAHWILQAIRVGKITIYGRPGYGGVGVGSRLFADYADHIKIPLYRIGEGDGSGISFDNNRLSYPPQWDEWEEWVDPETRSYSCWQYIDVKMRTDELRRVFLPDEPIPGDMPDDKSPPAEQAGKSPAVAIEHAGGRPPKYDWDEIWAHLAVYLAYDGVPETLDELVRIAQKLCSDKHLGEPAESTLKSRYRPLFQKLRDAKTGQAQA